MARVDFYVLEARDETARWQFACRLAEKAYRMRNRVHVLASDNASAHRFDELLWTWRDGSFVPHELAGGQTPAPVTVGCSSKPDGRYDLLINLTEAIPADLDAFARVAEIVTSDDEQRRQGRTRFAGYREQGHQLETHKL